MRLIIKNNYDECARWVANYIIDRILSFEPTRGRPFVMGLPTGSTALGIYKELIDAYEKKIVSFKNVVTFNMDEYIGLVPENKQSYHFFMWNNFFNHIDIKDSNVHILNGMAEDLIGECEKYEEEIRKAKGIELFLGGIGVDGHIAFNEPYSSLASTTRIKTLNDMTLKDNSRFFNYDINLTPKTALTVGIKTILDAREVLFMASGFVKAKAIYDVIEGPITHASTVSSLQLHKKAIIVCDDDATDELKVKTVRYFKNLEK